MTFVPVEARAGVQPIAVMNVPTPSFLQSGQSPFFGHEHPLGTIIRAYDSTGVQGEGEFIYLQGFSGQTAGQVVTWGGFGTVTGDPSTLNEAQYLAAAAPSTANLGQSLAVSMAAYPTGSPATAFGWFQIGGTANVQTNGTLATGSAVFLAGSGQLTSTVAAGKEVLNARSITATGTPATGFAYIAIDRPFAQGQIT